MGARPVEDRERLTPARPGLFVAAARVRGTREGDFRGRGDSDGGDGRRGRARRTHERERKRRGDARGQEGEERRGRREAAA